MYLYLPNLLPTSLKKNNNAQATSTTNSSYAPTLLCLLIYLNQRACISNNVYFLPKFFVIKIYTYTYKDIHIHLWFRWIHLLHLWTWHDRKGWVIAQFWKATTIQSLLLSIMILMTFFSMSSAAAEKQLLNRALNLLPVKETSSTTSKLAAS